MASSYEIKKGASINSIKDMLFDNLDIKMSKTFESSYYYNRERYDRDYRLCSEANTVVETIAAGDYGFASDIAKTVLANNKISEKQAYWIARTAWENEIDCVFVDGVALPDFKAEEITKPFYKPFK